MIFEIVKDLWDDLYLCILQSSEGIASVNSSDKLGRSSGTPCTLAFFKYV